MSLHFGSHGLPDPDNQGGQDGSSPASMMIVNNPLEVAQLRSEETPITGPMMPNTVIRTKNLGKCYQIYRRPQDRLKQLLWRGHRQFYRQFWALKDISFEVKSGETVGVIGRNGSGKSTLLNLIGGLDRPDTGVVQVGGDRIDQLSDRELAAWRSRHIGFVFQFYNLLAALNAAGNVELPLLLTHLSKSERKNHVETALRIVGLSHRMDH